MKLDTASQFFMNLKSETNSKSEIKVYENFVSIISDLEHRDFVNVELEGIENKLDLLDLTSDPDNRLKYYRKSLSEFKKYLKDRLSLKTKGYYTSAGLALGLAFGAAFGSVFGMGIGISLGMVTGLLIGIYMDSEAKKQNRVMNV